MNPSPEQFRNPEQWYGQELQGLKKTVNFNIKNTNPEKKNLSVYRDSLGLDKAGDITIENPDLTEAKLYEEAVKEYTRQNTEADQIYTEANEELLASTQEYYARNFYPALDKLDLFSDNA